jgi:hypothetical protein
MSAPLSAEMHFNRKASICPYHCNRDRMVLNKLPDIDIDFARSVKYSSATTAAVNSIRIDVVSVAVDRDGLLENFQMTEGIS